MASKDEQKEASGNPLFAALNKGGDITKGLKKVTRDMTNKDKKISGKIDDSKSKPKKKAAPAKAKTAKKVKPPATRKQGFRIWVENYVEGVVEIKDASLKNEVYIAGCSNTGIQIPSKCKSVIVDSCKKVQVEISEVLASVDMINSKSCTLYLKKSVPTLNIDKCEAPRVVTFQEVLDKDLCFVTSMTSDMNISVPGKTEEDDWKDLPVPYQFMTKIDPKTKQMTTTPMEHNG